VPAKAGTLVRTPTAGNPHTARRIEYKNGHRSHHCSRRHAPDAHPFAASNAQRTGAPAKTNAPPIPT